MQFYLGCEVAGCREHKACETQSELLGTVMNWTRRNENENENSLNVALHFLLKVWPVSFFLYLVESFIKRHSFLVRTLWDLDSKHSIACSKLWYFHFSFFFFFFSLENRVIKASWTQWQKVCRSQNTRYNYWNLLFLVQHAEQHCCGCVVRVAQNATALGFCNSQLNQVAEWGFCSAGMLIFPSYFPLSGFRQQGMCYISNTIW